MGRECQNCSNDLIVYILYHQFWTLHEFRINTSFKYYSEIFIEAFGIYRKLNKE